MKKLGLSKFSNKESLDKKLEIGLNNVSGGEKSRICIARAILCNRPIIILDEPTANLDNVTSDLVLDYLLSLEDKTIIMVLHKLDKKYINKFSEVINFNQ